MHSERKTFNIGWFIKNRHFNRDLQRTNTDLRRNRELWQHGNNNGLQRYVRNWRQNNTAQQHILVAETTMHAKSTAAEQALELQLDLVVAGQLTDAKRGQGD